MAEAGFGFKAISGDVARKLLADYKDLDIRAKNGNVVFYRGDKPISGQEMLKLRKEYGLEFEDSLNGR